MRLCSLPEKIKEQASKCNVLSHLTVGLAAKSQPNVEVTSYGYDDNDIEQYRFPDFGYVDHLNFCRENRTIWGILYEHISDAKKNKNERIKNIIDDFKQIKELKMVNRIIRA